MECRSSTVTALEDLANIRIPGPSGVELLAHIATPRTFKEKTSRHPIDS